MQVVTVLNAGCHIGNLLPFCLYWRVLSWCDWCPKLILMGLSRDTLFLLYPVPLNGNL